MPQQQTAQVQPAQTGALPIIGTPSGRPSPFVLHTFSIECLGGFATAHPNNLASATYPTANAAIFLPFRLREMRTYLQAIWANGAAVSGNIDVGVYDASGNKLASIGSTAQAGTTAMQQKAFSTPLLLVPGLYYLAVAMDNATGTLVKSNITTALSTTAGIRSLVSAFPLPANASAWVRMGLSGSQPLIGISEVSWL